MTMRRAVTGALAVVVMLVPQACGDPGKDYCAALEDDQEIFAEMQEDASGLGLLKQRDALRGIAEKAPDDLRDEWQVFLGALDAFAETLDDVGVEPDDFVDGQTPSGLGEAERTRIADAASELSSADVVAAADGIEQQAKDVCKLQLGL